MDIYTSTLTYEEVFARPTITTIGIEGRPALSFDGTQLYFLSTGRDGFGAQDNYVSSTRENRQLPDQQFQQNRVFG
jgi:hypothetical protein